jgi:hypothetical protein
MSLPSIDSEAQMSSSPDTWMLSAHCMASDFRLSLAPDIAEGIFKLLDLYEQGKDRMKDLERHYWAETARQQPSSHLGGSNVLSFECHSRSIAASSNCTEWVGLGAMGRRLRKVVKVHGMTRLFCLLSLCGWTTPVQSKVAKLHLIRMVC